MPLVATAWDSKDSYTENPNAIVCLLESTSLNWFTDRGTDLYGFCSVCVAASVHALLGRIVGVLGDVVGPLRLRRRAVALAALNPSRPKAPVSPWPSEPSSWRSQ